VRKIVAFKLIRSKGAGNIQFGDFAELAEDAVIRPLSDMMHSVRVS
jgi:hypothetical protein